MSALLEGPEWRPKAVGRASRERRPSRKGPEDPIRFHEDQVGGGEEVDLPSLLGGEGHAPRLRHGEEGVGHAQRGLLRGKLGEGGPEVQGQGPAQGGPGEALGQGFQEASHLLPPHEAAFPAVFLKPPEEKLQGVGKRRRVERARELRLGAILQGPLHPGEDPSSGVHGLPPFPAKVRGRAWGLALRPRGLPSRPLGGGGGPGGGEAPSGPWRRGGRGRGFP